MVVVVVVFVALVAVVALFALVVVMSVRVFLGDGVGRWGVIEGEEIGIDATDDLLLHGVEVLFFLGELLFEGVDACLGGEDVFEES